MLSLLLPFKSPAVLGVVAVLVGGIAVQTIRLGNAEKEVVQEQLRYSKRETQTTQTALTQSEGYRALAEQWNRQLGEIRNDVYSINQTNAGLSVALRDTTRGLREQSSSLAGTVRDATTAATAANRVQTAAAISSAFGVLTELYRGSEAVAGDLASALEEGRTAGEGCAAFAERTGTSSASTGQR